MYPADIHVQEELMTILAGFGCPILPKPSTLTTVIEQVARDQFMSKPAASPTFPLHTKVIGVPSMQAVYKRLSLSSRKVNSLLPFSDTYTHNS